MNAGQHFPLVVIADCDHDNVEPELHVFDEAGLDAKLAECRTSSGVIEQACEADACPFENRDVVKAVLTS